MTKVRKALAILGLASVLALCVTTPSVAQVLCGDRKTIVEGLEKEYGETRRTVGLLQQGRGVVETYASVKTGSWTILVTDTRGKSCLLAAGEAFSLEEPKEPEEKT